MSKGNLEIRIKTLGGADWEKVRKSIDEARKEYPEADIYVEWMI